MDLCAENTIEDSWNCLIESNGELLPVILFAECMWWLLILLGMRFGFQSLRKRLTKKRKEKRVRLKWQDKWTFPPKRNN